MCILSSVSENRSLEVIEIFNGERKRENTMWKGCSVATGIVRRVSEENVPRESLTFSPTCAIFRASTWKLGAFTDAYNQCIMRRNYWFCYDVHPRSSFDLHTRRIFLLNVTITITQPPLGVPRLHFEINYGQHVKYACAIASIHGINCIGRRTGGDEVTLPGSKRESCFGEKRRFLRGNNVVSSKSSRVAKRMLNWNLQGSC